jgi:hypothetical protein
MGSESQQTTGPGSQGVAYAPMAAAGWLGLLGPVPFLYALGQPRLRAT